MASSVGSDHRNLDCLKDYLCGACESKNIEALANHYCETCLRCFCEKCLYYHDQIYVNHLIYGRAETNIWPLAKTFEDSLLKCDFHNNKKLKMFCQNHSQLCCSDCVLLNHRQCTNLALISESAKKLSVDTQQLSNKIKLILAELNKFTRTQRASMQSVEGSYTEKVQEIRDLRKKLNDCLDELENTNLKELDELRTTLQNSLKKDIDNCSRLKDEFQQLGEAIQGIGDKSKKNIQFIASRKCLDKIQEYESYLKENTVRVHSSIIFQANTDIEKYLSKQSSLGRIVDSLKVLTVKRKSEYNVKISSDTMQACFISGICSLPSGKVIVVDSSYKKVILFDHHYNVSSHCNVSDYPRDICLITPSEVAVTLGNALVQFISVSNGQLVIERKLQLPHTAIGIAHRQGALYITSGTALYHYTLTGTLVKKLYEDTGVYRCALSPAGDRIYVTDNDHDKLLTLASDGSLISTFTDPELLQPWDVHVTPAGQVLVCGYSSHTVIQVDHEGRKKLATLALQKDGVSKPISVCCNTNNHQIIVGQANKNKIIVMELQ